MPMAWSPLMLFQLRSTLSSEMLLAGCREVKAFEFTMQNKIICGYKMYIYCRKFLLMTEFDLINIIKRKLMPTLYYNDIK